MKERYFIASNSSEGFCSYYEGAFDVRKFNKIYVIKGGSGTGKATFMKKVAEIAEEKGFAVRYIYCSSDVQSLDGIIIKELKIAVLDGTAPHIYEPKHLGAVEELVDLGQFLNGELLKNSRKLIENLNSQKQKCFFGAYRALKVYSELSKSIEALVLPYVKREKIEKYLKKFIRELKSGGGETEHLLTRSIGMRGLCSFDTYFEFATLYYEINDYFDTAHIFTEILYSTLSRIGTDMQISDNPIMKGRIDALKIKENGLTFEIGNGMTDGARVINMKRFIDCAAISNVRTEYRRLARLRDESLQLAIDEFDKIKKYHFLLEEIYGSAMDFKAKEQFTNDFCKKIFEKN